jgi:fatty acid desaturase
MEMKRYIAWLSVLLAGVGIGAVLAGSLAALLPLFLLACPLMMVFMIWRMNGMHDG